MRPREVANKGAFTNYVYKIWVLFDHLPPSSSKRSLWTAPYRKYRLTDNTFVKAPVISKLKSPETQGKVRSGGTFSNQVWTTLYGTVLNVYFHTNMGNFWGALHICRPKIGDVENSFHILYIFEPPQPRGSSWRSLHSRRLIKSSNESLGLYLFGKFKF